MELTPYHARYFAHELTKRSSSASVDSLTAALADAQVDLNPHQVEAALFAFRSPLSRGAILADEVGLGKTIEAGILLSQRWAERHRHLLVICPANLRKQWAQELAEKFFLQSAILETKTFNEEIKRGNLNPFDQPRVVLCSFQFARTKDDYIRQTSWDLVVIDEAHRLRNVYKPSNKISNAIKKAIAGRPITLLTATPLQNSLLELYGLVSFIDEYTFGDVRSFRSQFSRMNSPDDYTALRDRIRPICQRTLRRQVLPYISYTNRHALVQEFIPSEAEQQLYTLVSEYLQSPRLYALPASQRQLMTLILRKLLASSTYAISDTLLGLANKLEAIENTQTALDTIPPESLVDNFESLPEIEDEWSEDEPDENAPQTGAAQQLSPEQREELRAEKEKLREFHELAKSIQKNSKGEVLLSALRKGFEAATQARATHQNGALQQKAIIFTESRRTQEYLLRLLEASDFSGKVVLFNGTNSDQKSNEIYRNWLERNRGTDRVTGSPTADKRAALVEYFRDEASVMIATEAAAEGINLQFCNLVVNYDMPWNPQRIEQRIGRCHRYGQKYDVVVVNFLNRANAADVRIYQILAQKFLLFDGVFGASDEVLGSIQSGVDFEKRIVSIYQQCRTPEQIEFEFDALQKELESEVAQARSVAQEQLLNNFDQEVIEKVRIEAGNSRNRFEEMLWKTTFFYLQPYARFDSGYTFQLERNPFPEDSIHPGPYRMGRNVEDANTYRVGHQLAQRVLDRCLSLDTPPVELRFNLSKSGKRLSVLEPHIGHAGWLVCSKFAVESFESEEHILFAGLRDDGQPLDATACMRLFDLSAELGQPVLPVPVPALDEQLHAEKERILAEIGLRNSRWLDQETNKLDRWSEDLKFGLEQEIKDLDQQIRDTKRASAAAATLEEKLDHQHALKALQSTRNQKRKDLFVAQDQVEDKRDALIADIEARMAKGQTEEPVFTIRWLLQ